MFSHSLLCPPLSASPVPYTLVHATTAPRQFLSSPPNCPNYLWGDHRYPSLQGWSLSRKCSHRSHKDIASTAVTTVAGPRKKWAATLFKVTTLTLVTLSHFPVLSRVFSGRQLSRLVSQRGDNQRRQRGNLGERVTWHSRAHHFVTSLQSALMSRRFGSGTSAPG